MRVNDYTDYSLIGSARDDAAGEAFDKCARVLGLPYPGGAAMDKLASIGDSKKYKFTAGSVDGAEFDFTFSGLKTSVINLVHSETQRGRIMDEEFKADIATSFTSALVKSVTSRLELLFKQEGVCNVVLAGGVAANSHLRKAVGETAEKFGARLYLPPLKLCGDNAAMIASQGYFEYLAGVRGGTDLNAFATKSV
jgi:N6-L-threonylcarbamoyladenine synthase